MCVLFVYNLSDKCEVISHWFWFVFPWWLTVLSIFSCACWPMNFLFGKISIQLFCPFLNWIVFLMMSYMSSSYVLDVGHYQLSHLQIVISFCKLSFHFVNGFLCCAKTFKFNKVQFVYFCFYFLCFRRWIQKNITTVDVKECSAYVFL